MTGPEGPIAVTTEVRGSAPSTRRVYEVLFDRSTDTTKEVPEGVALALISSGVPFVDPDEFTRLWRETRRE